jgi:hypothetical protein
MMEREDLDAFIKQCDYKWPFKSLTGLAEANGKTFEISLQEFTYRCMQLGKCTWGK